MSFSPFTSNLVKFYQLKWQTSFYSKDWLESIASANPTTHIGLVGISVILAYTCINIVKMYLKMYYLQLSMASVFIATQKKLVCAPLEELFSLYLPMH